jgi:hypothetical protein
MMHEGPFPAHPDIKPPLGSILTEVLSSCHRARQLYRTENLHLPGHSLTAVVFRTLEETRCSMLNFTPKFHPSTTQLAATSQLRVWCSSVCHCHQRPLVFFVSELSTLLSKPLLYFDTWGEIRSSTPKQQLKPQSCIFIFSISDTRRKEIKS